MKVGKKAYATKGLIETQFASNSPPPAIDNSMDHVTRFIFQSMVGLRSKKWTVYTNSSKHINFWRLESDCLWMGERRLQTHIVSGKYTDVTTGRVSIILGGNVHYRRHRLPLSIQVRHSQSLPSKTTPLGLV